MSGSPWDENDLERMLQSPTMPSENTQDQNRIGEDQAVAARNFLSPEEQKILKDISVSLELESELGMSPIKDFIVIRSRSKSQQETIRIILERNRNYKYLDDLSGYFQVSNKGCEPTRKIPKQNSKRFEFVPRKNLHAV